MKSAVWISFFLFVINAHADDLRYFARPEQALAGFDEAIGDAKSTIDIATFIYEPCHASVRVLTENLIAKAKAGVHVRVLLDAFQQSLSQRAQIENEFEQAGIELRFYSSSIFDINLRMHAKFMIVDGTKSIAGGRNLADQYFDISNELNYVDRDISAEGASSGSQAEAAFNKLWASDMVSTADPGSGDSVDWNSFCGINLDASIATVRNYLQVNGASILAGVPVRSCAVQFSVDDPDFYKPQFGPSWDSGAGAENFLTSSRLNVKRATQAVLSFVNNTKSNLYGENYEYIPITKLEAAFRRLRKRKIPVQILTNQDIEAEGPAFYVEAQEYELAKRQAADERGSEWIGLVSSQGALSTNFVLSPVAPPRFIHGKILSRDNKDVLVGSFNLDARSANINVETAVVVSNCPDLAADVMAGYNDIHSQFETDVHSPNPPPKPEPSLFAKMFGDLLITEF